MDPVIVKPNAENLKLSQIVEPTGLSDENILPFLRVTGIEVDTAGATWSVDLDVIDREAWLKTASKMSREEFDLCLARAGQELRKKVPGLEKVYWRLPEDCRSVLRKGPGTNGNSKSNNGKTNNGGSGEPGVLVGKPIRTTPVPISGITGGEKESVTVSGEVVEVTWKQGQSGEFVGTLIVTDRTDSITVKIFSKEGKIDEISEGSFVTVRGRVRLDRLDSEPVIICSDLCLSEPVIREDTAPFKRVELHLHTKMSQMDSVLDLSKAVARAKRWGHQAIAVTDHGVVQAFPEAAVLGQKYGIKIIYGVEGYLVEDNDEKGQAYHVILLAKTQKGLRNLYEIITKSHLEYFYRTPRIPRNLLSNKREGLIVGSACEAGEVFRAVISGKSDDELKKIASFYDYLEIQPLDNNSFLVSEGTVKDRDALAELNRRIYRLSKELGKPCVVTCDVHYLDPEDEIYRTLLLSGKGMAEGERTVPLYFRTTGELLEETARYLGEEAAKEVVVDNPCKIAASCEDIAPVPEGSYFPSLDNADSILRELAEQGAKKRYGENLPPIVKARLEKELSAIIGNGFSSLYLIAIKMVQKSLQDGYLVGSRGSVGSSLVATCTGITEVNPLVPHYVCPRCYWTKFFEDGSYGSGFDLPRAKCPQCGEELLRDGQDIPFETFMGFKGEKVPDIDLNFSGEEQGEMFKFASELLGERNVFRAGTIGTIARKTAFGFVKHFAEEHGKTFRKAEEIRLAKGIEGVKRTTGQHPGGVMVIPRGKDVLEFTPLQYPADDRNSGAITTHFDYNSISGHLVKVDILGHDDPTVLKMLHELTGIDPTTVPMDDPDTLRLFSGDNPDDVVGIPEFGTRFVRGMLAETKPRSFSDLVRISGLSHGTDVWANNARDLIRDKVATLDQVIATREDIFLYLMKMGMEDALAFSIAEKVRKGKPLSEQDIARMKEVSVPDWYIESCKKISYLFPKAHAAAYVTTAFRIAYFKVHHPVAFYAAYFSFHGSSLTTDLMYLSEQEWKEYIEKTLSSPNASAKEQEVAGALEVALEMVRRGIRFAKPDLYISQAKNYVPQRDTLVPPFVAIPGLGTQAASAIVNARSAGEFTSVEDFRKRTRLGKKVCDILKKEGVLAGLPENSQLLLFK